MTDMFSLSSVLFCRVSFMAFNTIYLVLLSVQCLNCFYVYFPSHSLNTYNQLLGFPRPPPLTFITITLHPFPFHHPIFLVNFSQDYVCFSTEQNSSISGLTKQGIFSSENKQCRGQQSGWFYSCTMSSVFLAFGALPHGYPWLVTLGLTPVLWSYGRSWLLHLQPLICILDRKEKKRKEKECLYWGSNTWLETFNLHLNDQKCVTPSPLSLLAGKVSIFSQAYCFPGPNWGFISKEER